MRRSPPTARLIYGAVLQQGGAVQSKNPASPDEAEGLLLRHADCTIHDMACDAQGKRLALSLSGSGWGERNIAVMPLDANRFRFVTEGECRDSNPAFDPANGDILYYDSCGLARTEHGLVFSPRAVNRLHLADGTLDTVLADDKHDYFQPRPDGKGGLYCIRRPYRSGRQGGSGLRDLALAPVKISKALFGWLDFFTRRYGGEPLKTSGANPAKAKQQSEEERFIEGNLIKVRQNKKADPEDRRPAAIPADWELVRVGTDGSHTVLLHSVMAYAVEDGGGIVYSDGRGILRRSPEGETALLAEAEWAEKLRLQP
ncbi:hypothetical protein [Kingella potus]|uniref:hypothetical protein n=1 Tax=Kingella potus TaxID=265175 RepID=UPI001FCF7BD9|nr:hypothetical protein [Kingella potus]UOP00185.1 hypothetical protein LVJ84_09615 [Kingella potus]